MPSFSRRLQSWIPNGPVLALFALLIVVAISIALAVIFPYEDLNAQNAAAAALAENSGVIVDSSNVGGVGSGSGGIFADSGVGVGGSALTQSSGNGEGIVTQDSAEAPNTEQTESNESSIVNNNAGGESLNELVTELLSAESSVATSSTNDKLLTTDTSNVVSNNEDNSSPTSTSQQQDHSSLFDNENTPSDSTTGVISSPTMSPTVSIVPTSPTAAATEDDIHQQQQECQTLLQQADLDSSKNIMDAFKYVTFLTDLQKKLTQHDYVGEEEGSTNRQYNDLPAELKMNFVHLSCMCPKTNENCCAEWVGIYIGDVVGNDITIEENYEKSESMSARICAQTLSTVGDLLDQWE